MDNRPIGIFDSGVGGLTAVRKLKTLLPNENIIYFGDSGRMPYGGRPIPEIYRIAEQDSAFLIDKNVKAIMAACGTTDSNAMAHLKEILTTPVSGIIAPSVSAAAAATRTGRIGIIATEATAKSDAFGRALLKADPSLRIVTQGCPLIAPLAEHGHTGKDDPLLREALEGYLAPVIAADVDTLLLGCTHYPLVSAAILELMDRDVTLIDSGAEGAAALARYLAENDMLRGESGAGQVTYYTSGDEAMFASVAEIFLGGQITGSVRFVEPFAL
jgi:glutamate racemase